MSMFSFQWDKCLLSGHPCVSAPCVVVVAAKKRIPPRPYNFFVPGFRIAFQGRCTAYTRSRHVERRCVQSNQGLLRIQLERIQKERLTVFRRFSLPLIILLAFSTTGLAQNVTATLRGTVHDPSGAGISGAFVTVTNTGTGIAHKTVTNNAGDYVVVELAVGTYSVEVTASGFDSSTYTGVVLNVDQNARVDAALRVGSVSQNIAVSSTAILIQSEDAVNGNLLSGRQLQELPSNNRNIWQEAQYLPNVSATTTGDSLANRGGFIVAGINNSGATNYLIDGSDDNDWTTGQPTVRPSTDAISDFRIITGEAPAEYGSKNGGQVVLNTRAGTNVFHGGAFFYYRDGKWNAPLYDFQYPTIVPVPSSESKQFGGSFGGPIKKDRTFFFATYEGTRLSADPGVNGSSPLDAWKGGTYTSDGNAHFTTQILDPTTGKPFPQSSPGIWEIPYSRISAASKILLKYFPEANSQTGFAANNFANHVPNTQNENQGTFRLDQKISEKDSIFGVYTILKGYDAGTTGDLVVANSVVPGFGGSGPHIYQHASIAEDHIFSANLVNNLRIGFNRMDAGYYNQDAGQGNVAGTLGLPQGGNYMDLPTNGNTGVPSVGITSLSSIGTSGNPQWRGDNTVTLSDALTWVHQNHTFKVGLQAVDFFKHSFYIANGRGTFNFNGQYTGGNGNVQNAFADFLLGYIDADSYQQGNQNQYPIQHSGGLYAQDEWKPIPTLTLNYGLRWDYFGPVREAYNNISYFNATTNNVYTGAGPYYSLNDSTGLLQQAGTVPSRRDNYAAIYHNFAPRLGFAYRLQNHGETVIRGGFGIYYGIPVIETWNSANGLGVPFVLTKSFTAPVPSASTHVTANPYLWGPAAFGTAGTQTLNSLSLTAIDPHINTLYTEQYSLGIQHELGKAALVEISYQGSRTVHNVSSLSINQPTLATRLANPAVTLPVNSLRPFNTVGSQSDWAGITYISDALGANYNSLLVQAQRRFDNGLTFESYLVYSKAMEDAGVVNDPAYSKSLNYGPTTTDQRFRSVTTGLYNLPFGAGQRWLSNSSPVVRYVVGGWRATTVLTLQSGRPFSTSTNDTYASYTGNGGHAFINPAGGSPNAAIDTNTGLHTHIVKNWYNTGAFRSNSPANGNLLSNTANNPPGTAYVYSYGNAGYNNLRGPGLQDVDFGLIKEVRLYEQQSVQFRADAFNILNHPNFINPSAAYGGPGPSGNTTGTTGVISSTVAAGTSTATGANRQLQLSLRYSF